MRIRPPRGHEEEWLAMHAGEPPVSLATGLLERCLVDVAGVAPSPPVVDALTIGDREALLWEVRRAAFGDRIDAVVECRACGEKLDISLTVDELLAEPYEDWAEQFTDKIGDWSVTYRLPTGADLAGTGSGGDAADLMASCVMAIDGTDLTDEVSTELTGLLGQLMARRDPQAETQLTAQCPECGAEVVAVLDAFSFLGEELVRHGTFLQREVHTLAWHYHWSEDDILSLTVGRRMAYLDLIAEAYEAPPP